MRICFVVYVVITRNLKRENPVNDLLFTLSKGFFMYVGAAVCTVSSGVLNSLGALGFSVSPVMIQDVLSQSLSPQTHLSSSQPLSCWSQSSTLPPSLHPESQIKR